MQGPLAPGERRRVRAPLPSAALIVGGLLCALALLVAMARKLVSQLALDPLVVRALCITIWVAAFMLVRVAQRASAGWRRIAALAIGLPLIVGATALAVVPAWAAIPFERGWGALASWIFGVPGVLALLLSRWRVSS
ncbi:MAG TPA: hypothetical protein PLI95_03575 [Polyangiaceae bacterium]|nr:hypothetical protein [Polyangiaceae bacterium]